MIKFVLSNFFNKNIEEKRPLTIIDSNRANVDVKQRIILQKKERQKTCLSKYFEDIKGLNSIERNIYCKITF